MTRFGWLVSVIVLLVFTGIAAFLFLHPKPEETPTPEPTGNENLEGQSIYASGEYGFTFRYPSKDAVSEDFSTFYHLPPDYRANGTAEATGTPLIQVTEYATESDHSFPRYFSAMVRIGVSDDPDDVKSCEAIVKDAGETALPDKDINGTTWKAFSFQNAGMMQYLKGVSYRVVHEDKCFVMEKLATGSNYMDDPDSPDDIPQSRLDEAYDALDAIVDTFTFSRP